MVDTKAVSTAVSTSPEQKTMMELINSSTKELAKALPKHLSPERLARIATTSIRQNPKLAQCTPASFMGALFTSAQLGLEPVAGLAHLVPFNNSKFINGGWTSVLECQFIIGYKGVAELFYRHEKSGLIDWGVVHEKDELSFEYGTNSHLKHKPAQGERGKVVGYYGIFKLSNGFSKFLYMTAEECMSHGKKHSKTFNSKENKFNAKSPWATNPDAMCLKTVLLQVAKTAPMSTDLRRALDTDETTREFKEGITDALDLPSTTNWTEAEVEAIPTADTSKVAGALKQEPTVEELKAIAERKAAEYQDTTLPKEEVAAPTSDSGEGVTVATGLIEHLEAPNKWGFVKVSLDTYTREFTTKDEILIEILTRKYNEKIQVSLKNDTVQKGKYTNYYIKGLISQG